MCEGGGGGWRECWAFRGEKGQPILVSGSVLTCAAYQEYSGTGSASPEPQTRPTLSPPSQTREAKCPTRFPPQADPPLAGRREALWKRQVVVRSMEGERPREPVSAWMQWPSQICAKHG